MTATAEQATEASRTPRPRPERRASRTPRRPATARDSDDGPATSPRTAQGDNADKGDKKSRVRQLEREGEVAADFLETLLDIADLDGDIDVDVDGDRAAIAIVDSDEGRVPRRLVGTDGKVLEALQELTRLAVQAQTGERSRLMLDVAGYRAERRSRAGRARQGRHRGGAGVGDEALARADDRLRAQGRPRRGGGRRARVRVRGCRAAPSHRHPA